jgi:hypothetical protein
MSKAAARCNPAVRALYQRLRARGKRADVAMGHCMRKLLHLVFAVWTTNRPFDPNHYAWENPRPSAAGDDPVTTHDNKATSERVEQSTKEAAGHTRIVDSETSVVTEADGILARDHETVNAPVGQTTHWIDYQAVRAQVSLERILEHLDLLKTLRPSGGELRGTCPIHSSDDKRRRDFAVNLKKDVFCCFHPSCEARGNQLDLWARLHDQTTYQAAQDLTSTFQLTTTGLEKRSP